MSMFTGMDPRAHGVLTPADTLRDRYLTITELLRNVGYRTVAVTDGGLMSAEYGFDQGFDVYDDRRGGGGQDSNGFQRFGQRLLHWFPEHREEPFFLFVHTFDTHGPYVAASPAARRALLSTEPVVPDAVRSDPGVLDYMRQLRVHDYLMLDRYEDFAQLVDDYDATIRTVDDWIGRILDVLEAEGLLEDTLLIVTSDHGESLYDHRLYVGHGLLTYEDVIRVPLVVHFPGDRFAGTRSDQPVSLLDFYATIAAAAAIEWPATVQGEDLAALLTDPPAEPRPLSGTSPNLDGSLFLRMGRMKYIEAPRVSLPHLLRRHLHHPEEGDEDYDLENDPLDVRGRIVLRDQLYDLAVDPGETRNLFDERPAIVERAREWLNVRERDDYVLRELHRGEDEIPVLDEQTIETLHELGYISESEMHQQIRDLRTERHEAWRRKMQREAGGG